VKILIILGWVIILFFGFIKAFRLGSILS